MSSGQPDGLGNAMAAESHHHDDHGGNYGPVIGILFLIAFLTGGALAVARYLVGPQAFQRTGYDLEAFVQRKCAVCVGGGAGKPAADPPVESACQLEPEATEEEVVEASETPVEKEGEEEPVEEEEEESAADP